MHCKQIMTVQYGVSLVHLFILVNAAPAALRVFSGADSKMTGLTYGTNGSAFESRLGQWLYFSITIHRL